MLVHAVLEGHRPWLAVAPSGIATGLPVSGRMALKNLSPYASRELLLPSRHKQFLRSFSTKSFSRKTVSGFYCICTRLFPDSPNLDSKFKRSKLY